MRAISPEAYASRYGRILQTPKIGLYYEEILEQVYRQFVSQGDICIDAGAHKGRHTMPLASLVGEEGKVVAYEPIPDLAQRLAKRGQSKWPNTIEVMQKALSKAPGSKEFCVATQFLGYSGLKERDYPDETEIDRIEVEIVTINDEFRNRGPVRFIKLDLEGGEFDALRGAANVLSRDRPLLGFEFGRQDAADRYGYTKKDFFDFFADIDYEVVDAFGEVFDERYWEVEPFPFYFFGFPNDDTQATVHFRVIRDASISAFQMLAEARPKKRAFLRRWFRR